MKMYQFKNFFQLKVAIFFAFLSTVPAANYLISNVGTFCVPDGPCLIPIGFGITAPSGVLLIGLALVLRDYLQELTNWKWSAIAVLSGAIISMMISSPYLAMASAITFLVAEFMDLVVYTKLRSINSYIAVLGSGFVGAILDSCLFLYLAFGSLDHAFGNSIGKIYASIAVAAFLFWRHTRKNNLKDFHNA